MACTLSMQRSRSCRPNRCHGCGPNCPRQCSNSWHSKWRNLSSASDCRPTCASGRVMLNTSLTIEERITTAHRAKLAYVYVRQSSPGQVRHHQESTELQYRLVERVVLLGWPRERVQVIDDDLGKSGTSSDERYGFQRLIAEV